ncbi:hypothetical protein FB451DRAFT_1093539 [Mycena latifolia]|nr:hypothetical protein FB451DRAFT_1093539 [Mycena latifolia]
MRTMGASAIASHPVLPPEIWLACWILCSTRQLRRLSSVCHLFRSLCLPLLFQDQLFDGIPLQNKVDPDNWIDRVRHLHRTAVRLDRMAEGHHAMLVRSWKFCARITAHPFRLASSHPDIQNINIFDTVYDRIITTFSTTLSCYRNLRSLHIQGLTIDTPFRETLLSLPMLDSLTLFNCDIIAEEGPLIKLMSFMISETRRPSDTRPSRLVSTECLRSLDFPSLRAWSLVACSRPPEFPHLLEISLGDLSDVTLFFTVLKQCPRLERLAILSLDPTQAPSLPGSIHPSTIPSLRHLTAQRKLIRLFTPNRPVSAVRVVDMQRADLLPVFLEISRTSAPLLSLEILSTSPSEESMAAMASLFPCLREIMLEIREGSWHACGRPQQKERVVDRRCLSLCDDDAFDDLPSEAISDAEEDEPSIVVVVPGSGQVAGNRRLSSLQHTCRRICTDRFPLPPTIEVLGLQTGLAYPELIPVSAEQCHQTIAALSQQCPLLREVHLGLPCNIWKRAGALWKQEGVNSYVQVNACAT